MAPSAVSETPLPIRSSKQGSVHPFAPLSENELLNAGSLIRAEWPASTDLQFKVITLEEPPKAEVFPYLEAEHTGNAVPSIDRRALVVYYIRKTNKLHEAFVNLSTQSVESNVRLGNNIHAPGDAEEFIGIEKLCLEDASVQAELAKLKLPEGSVVV